MLEQGKILPRQRQQVGIIGASHIFTGPVARDLCFEPRLAGSEVALFDLNEERALNTAKVCQRLADEVGADIRFKSVPSRTAVIQDTDILINTALHGGRELGDRVKRAVAERTGIYGPIEAHAPYGQLRLMLDIAQDLEKIAPHATLIQCANPIPEGGTLITKETGVRFIGVCHGYKEWEHLARVLGMNPELAHVSIAGINHDVWLIEFLYQNQDAYPRLDEWIRETADHWLRTFLPHAKNVDYQLSRAAFDLYRRFGVMPIGDTTRASTPELSRYGYHDSPEDEERFFGKEQGFESPIGEAKSREWRTTSLADIDRIAKEPGSVQPIFPRGPSGWQIVPIMVSLATNQPSIQEVNIRNGGSIKGLSDDMVVEVPAIVNAQGAHTEGTIEIPPAILERVLLPRAEQAKAHIDAFITGDVRPLREQLLRNHKLQGNPATADAIIDVWRSFDPDMAAHFSR